MSSKIKFKNSFEKTAMIGTLMKGLAMIGGGNKLMGAANVASTALQAGGDASSMANKMKNARLRPFGMMGQQ